MVKSKVGFATTDGATDEFGTWVRVLVSALMLFFPYLTMP